MPTLTKRGKYVVIGVVVAAIVIGVVLLGLGLGGCFASKKPSQVAPPFPIDVVCTWVDGRDAAWRASVEEHYLKELVLHPHAGMYHSPMREPGGRRALDELHYVVYLIAKFMPWVRTFYLVTQRPHKPLWWKDKVGNMTLKLVHHDEIWEDTSQLPVFNSNAITKHIDRIPGLAEHFVLFDDDCFVGQPMQWSNFFTADGRPVIRTRHMHAETKEGNWGIQVSNLDAAIQSVAGANHTVHSPVHVCSPHVKSVYTYVVHDLFKVVTNNFKRFRSNADVPTQYLVVAWMHAQRKLVPLPKQIVTKFLLAGHLKTLLPFWPHLFCINDRLDDTDFAMLELLLNQK